MALLADYLAEKTNYLSNAGISTARLDILVLLEDILQKDRAHLLAHPELSLPREQLKVLDEYIERRATHIPLAYIRGKVEFYGREFAITEAVLQPRPESETMIDILKSVPLPQQFTLVDVGCGSGALAITAALELPAARAIAIDIDSGCVAVTQENADKLRAEVEIIEGDLVSPLSSRDLNPYVLLCNLPYVPDDFHINMAATHEPYLAIFGGTDGLDVYRTLFSQLRDFAHQPRYILTEALPPQHKQLHDIAKNYGYVLKANEDFIQVFSQG